MPNLSGLTLTTAKVRLTRARCRVGTVSYVLRKGRRPNNRVYRQSLRANVQRVVNTKVGITINGRRPRPKPTPKARSSAVVGTNSRVFVAVLNENNPPDPGSDANPCTRIQPCRTFAKAITELAQNGILTIIGDGEYGPVTIDHSLTIEGPGTTSASINAGTGNAITVAAGTNEKVILRNLDLASATPCTTAGTGDGVRFESGGALHLDNVTADGFAGSGVSLVPAEDRVVTIQGGALTRNCTAGLSASRPGGAVSGSAGALTVVTDGLLMDSNATGITAGDGVLVQMHNSQVSENATAFAVAGNGNIQGWPQNVFTPNTAQGWVPGALPLS